MYPFYLYFHIPSSQNQSKDYSWLISFLHLETLKSRSKTHCSHLSCSRCFPEERKRNPREPGFMLCPLQKRRIKLTNWYFMSDIFIWAIERKRRDIKFSKGSKIYLLYWRLKRHEEDRKKIISWSIQEQKA